MVEERIRRPEAKPYRQIEKIERGLCPENGRLCEWLFYDYHGNPECLSLFDQYCEDSIPYEDNERIRRR